jgi:hypothetical protein
MPHNLPNPWPDGELQTFLDHFLYEPAAFLVDSVELAADGVIEATCDTQRDLPISAMQRGDPKKHPRHVSAPELVLATGSLGCLHAYFFHGCRWQDGWVGFGSRIHRADFRDIVRRGPPMTMRSVEVRKRVQPKRVVLRLEFEFMQEGRLVYRGDQTAMFVLGTEFE